MKFLGQPYHLLTKLFTNMKMKLLPVVLISGSLFAQERTTASGGEASSGSGSVSYSVGLIDFITASGTDGTVSQGVQQPFELFAVGVEEWDNSIVINAYPNPTTSNLTIAFGSIPTEDLMFELTDEAGRVVRKGGILSQETVIDLQSLAVASYFLNIKQSDRLMRSYKIIKNH